jgi:hypothetical protein
MPPMTVNYKPASRALRNMAGDHPLIFNDRLVDGTRSYKVTGWHKPRYTKAKQQLEKLGYTVEVKRVGYIHRWGSTLSSAAANNDQYRLHVK